MSERRSGEGLEKQRGEARVVRVLEERAGLGLLLLQHEEERLGVSLRGLLMLLLRKNSNLIMCFTLSLSEISGSSFLLGRSSKSLRAHER